MIKGPWVVVWARRMKRYAQANNIDIPTGFRANVPSWGAKKGLLALRIKKHAHVPSPDRSLDGALRAVLLQFIKDEKAHAAWQPRIVDARHGKSGFPYNANGSWGGKRSTDDLFLVCHYTGGLGSLRADASYHVGGHGWRNLSYHFAVDRDGTLYWSNDVEDLTWHARGFNSKGVGLSFVGDESGPTLDQRRTLEWFIKTAVSKGGIPALGVPRIEKVTRHEDAQFIDPSYSTSCPGRVGREFYAKTAGTHFTTHPLG